MANLLSREMKVGKHFAAGLTHPYAGGEADAARIVARITAFLSIGAGVIHISAAGDHTNLPVMMAGFLVVAALQVGLGALLLWRRPSGLLVAAAVAMMLASVGLWLLSRTRGIPYLPGGHMEPIGFKDGITVFFELAAVPGLLLLLSRELAQLALPSARLGMQAMTIAAAGTFALMVPALALEGGAHHSHDEAVALGIHEHGEGEAHGDPAAHAHEEGEGAHAGEHADAEGGHADARGGAHAHDQFASAGASSHPHGLDVAADDVTHSHSGREPSADRHEHGGDGGDHQTGGDHGGGHQHERGGGEQQHDAGGEHQHGEDPHAGHGEDPHAGHGGEGEGAQTPGVTYEPAQPAQDGRPARGPAIVWRGENMPYEEGAHSGEFHHTGRGECRPTAEQQAVADKLYADSTAALKRYENRPDLALADGFWQVVGPADRFVHMINFERVFDPTILDPNQIESFMYAMTDRGLVPLGAMYIMPAEFKDGRVTPTEPKHGPEVAGCLTRWHKHEGWVAGFSTGGTNWEETPEMLHVWTYPGLDPWSHYQGPELSQLWQPWKDVPSVCRISYPGGTNVCFP